MGRRLTTGGVEPLNDRIQLTFVFQGKRFRPTLNLKPSAANLKHAERRLHEIKRKIALGLFSFVDEFPSYRFMERIPGQVIEEQKTFNKIADQYLESIGDLEYATRQSYKKILKAFWRPNFGESVFIDIRYSQLAALIGGHPWGSAKTRNNVISVGRRVFDFGYGDIEDKRNPAEKLKSFRVQKQPPDPYTIDDAEAVIKATRDDWGDAFGDQVEFAFFTGLRPSELIALNWPEIDQVKGVARIKQARVMGQAKTKTKTSVVRDVELCPRAIAVLKRQYERTGLANKTVFMREGHIPFHDIQVPGKRWQFSHKRLKIRYREPYQTRHTSVTWNLMIGKNILWVAQNHGHSAAVMLKTYAKWLAGTTDEDVARIKKAMGYASTMPVAIAGIR